jgi:hypothetical protein
VLRGIPKNANYEETLQGLEESFGDQHFAAAFRSQLKTRKAGDSLQDFATAVEQLAHRAYPTLPEDHKRREAGKAFGDRVEDQDKNFTADRRIGDGNRGPQTGPRTTCRIPSRQTPQDKHQDTGGAARPLSGEGTRENHHAGTVENRDTSWVTAPTK